MLRSGTFDCAYINSFKVFPSPTLSLTAPSVSHISFLPCLLFRPPLSLSVCRSPSPCLSLSLCFSLCLSISSFSLSTFLSVFSVSVSSPLSLSLFLPLAHSVYLSVSLSLKGHRGHFQGHLECHICNRAYSKCNCNIFNVETTSKPSCQYVKGRF